MARLPRLTLTGEPHLVLLRGLAQRAIVVDDEDRRLALAALREASMQHGLALHGYALMTDRLRLLVSPAGPQSLALAMQDFGRRYVAGFNRRHGQRGTLWDGRYRGCAVQPGAWALAALVLVEGEPARFNGTLEVAERPGWTSAAHHLGQLRDPQVSPLLAYWQLGNTPFEREAAYARRLSDGLPAALQDRLEDGCRKGWPVGDSGFLDALARQVERPIRGRPRGRPAASRP